MKFLPGFLNSAFEAELRTLTKIAEVMPKSEVPEFIWDTLAKTAAIRVKRPNVIRPNVIRGPFSARAPLSSNVANGALIGGVGGGILGAIDPGQSPSGPLGLTSTPNSMMSGMFNGAIGGALLGAGAGAGKHYLGRNAMRGAPPKRRSAVPSTPAQ